MDVIKQLFGFALLAVPILLLSRLLRRPGRHPAPGSAGRCCCAAISITTTSIAPRWAKSLGGFVLLLAMMTWWWWAGPAAARAWRQGQHRGRGPSLSASRPWMTSRPDSGRPRQAGAAGPLRRLVRGLQEFEHKTFSDPEVRARFADMVLLQADVTANDDADVDLLNGLNVLGLPTLIFFDRDGNEVSGQRVTGFMGPAEFLGQLDKLR